MKKTTLTVATALTLAGSIMFTSCIGSFNLTNKLLSWNKSIGNKFVNELVFIAFWILPVYEISGLADIVVLNSIEFWSGSNPVAQGTRYINGNDGRYKVVCDATGYTITSENDGTVTRLDFNADTRSWSTTIDGQEVIFLTYVDDTHVKLPAPDGSYRIIETSQQGLYAYQQIALNCNLAQTTPAK